MQDVLRRAGTPGNSSCSRTSPGWSAPCGGESSWGTWFRGRTTGPVAVRRPSSTYRWQSTWWRMADPVGMRRVDAARRISWASLRWGGALWACQWRCPATGGASRRGSRLPRCLASSYISGGPACRSWQPCAWRRRTAKWCRYPEAWPSSTAAAACGCRRPTRICSRWVAA